LIEKPLRLGKGHIDEEIVEFRHADLKDRGDRIDLAARGNAERRLGAVRGQDFDLVADAKAEIFGEPLTDCDAARRIEAIECALFNVMRNSRKALNVCLP